VPALPRGLLPRGLLPRGMLPRGMLPCDAQHAIGCMHRCTGSWHRWHGIQHGGR
jgi:hypothetical protein